MSIKQVSTIITTVANLSKPVLVKRFGQGFFNLFTSCDYKDLENEYFKTIWVNHVVLSLSGLAANQLPLNLKLLDLFH